MEIILFLFPYNDTHLVQDLEISEFNTFKENSRNKSKSTLLRQD